LSGGMARSQEKNPMGTGGQSACRSLNINGSEPEF
jgi:hypothetical protein